MKDYCFNTNKDNIYNKLYNILLGSNNLCMIINNPFWEIHISDIVEYYDSYNSVLNDFNNFLEKEVYDYDIDSSTILPEYSTSKTLIIYIILTKLKKNQEYQNIKKYLLELNERDLCFLGLFLCYNILSTNDLEDELQNIGLFNCLNYLNEYTKLFFVIFLYKEKRYYIEEVLGYQYNIFFKSIKNMNENELSIFLYHKGILDGKEHLLQDIAEFFENNAKAIRKTLRETNSLFASNLCINKERINKSHYYDRHLHKIKLNINDSELLKIIIYTDILHIQRHTGKYYKILRNICQFNIIDNIITMHKENSLAYTRSLYLLKYEDYKIIEYCDHLKSLDNYCTIKQTAERFWKSQEYIKSIILKFQSYFSFFKEYYNDTLFVDIPL